ncbi:MAG: AAA family ATPase [Chitinophagaceae bacterium]
MIKKIVVIGPESTGKSTLCSQLAAHYKTLWCPEFARQYLIDNGTNYTFDDLATIAKGQLELEAEYEVRSTKYEGKTEDQRPKIKNPIPNSQFPLTAHQFLFLDTDMYVMKVWCEFVFGKCHQFILDEIQTRKYDLYLLCNIDLPWVQDELREYPDEKPRQELFAIYQNILSNQSTPWYLISGTNEERLQNAINAINATFNL